MTWYRAIGLMSGTSMDGVDIGYIETDGRDGVRQGPQGFVAYSDAERDVLRSALEEAQALTDRTTRPGALAEAQAIVDRRHRDAISGFMRENALSREAVDVVGFHGQTVLHRPEQQLTVQIGDGAALAHAIGIPVVWDMRAADVEAGGQGAPLVPAYHRALAGAEGIERPVCVLNLGGVGNVTFVPAHGDPVAFDTGPANALIDEMMLARTGVAMDRDGRAAARGAVDTLALARLLDDAYFAKPPPKSLDRKHFSGAPVMPLSTQDAAATLTAFTAETVARSLALLPEIPRRLVVCGGGARNPTLMGMLRTRCPCPVVTADTMGWSADAMEAQAFAYLAVRSLMGLPLTFPGTTGVAAPQTGGVLSRPV